MEGKEGTMEQPKSAADHYEHGRMLKQRQMFAQALEEFQQAATDPRYAGNAHVQIALCLRSTHRGEEAVTAFRRALEVATFSSKDKAHILSHLGQTLESLGQYAEALQAYGWSRKEDPSLQDVAHRIKHLCAGGRGPVPQHRLARQLGVADMLNERGHLRLRLPSLLEQSWNLLGRPLEIGRWVNGKSPGVRDMPPVSTDRPVMVRRSKMIKRQHVRVAIQCRSHFSLKSRKVAGEGELRDLSPGGCRVTSSVVVPVGAELECLIFPQDAGNPFTIEGAMVRWSRPQEFGLSFTTVRPGVQHRIVELCRTRRPL
jgi:PilZ domain/Tetratricopeptide repeat